MNDRKPIQLAPGQSSSLSFRLDTDLTSASQSKYRIAYRTKGSNIQEYTVAFLVIITSRHIDEPHKVTFKNPNGIVSYAIFQAPASDTSLQKYTSLAVLLNLHGAGLEADSDQVRHHLDAARPIPAFVMYPTGGTAWSGDDWRM